MLCRLAEKHPTAVAQLALQYRMHQEICQLSNIVVYNGALKCANDSVRNKTLALRQHPSQLKAFTGVGSWLTNVVDPKRPVVFVDTDGNLEMNSAATRELSTGKGQLGGIVNYTEVSLVKKIVESFALCGVPMNDVGVICPFRAQVRRGNSLRTTAPQYFSYMLLTIFCVSAAPSQRVPIICPVETRWA
jgi:DNA replication ATP-dependent helicase Dna2